MYRDLVIFLIYLLRGLNLTFCQQFALRKFFLKIFLKFGSVIELILLRISVKNEPTKFRSGNSLRNRTYNHSLFSSISEDTSNVSSAKILKCSFWKNMYSDVRNKIVILNHAFLCNPLRKSFYHILHRFNLIRLSMNCTLIPEKYN